MSKPGDTREVSIPCQPPCALGVSTFTQTFNGTTWEPWISPAHECRDALGRRVHVVSPTYVRAQLRETLNVDVPESVVEDVIAKGKFLVFRAPTRDVELWDGQANEFFVAASLDEVRGLTRGWNWNNARVTSANVLRGADQLLR